MPRPLILRLIFQEAAIWREISCRIVRAGETEISDFHPATILRSPFFIRLIMFVRMLCSVIRVFTINLVSHFSNNTYFLFIKYEATVYFSILRIVTSTKYYNLGIHEESR